MEVDRYFHSRSRASQISAAVSDQSRILRNRADLEERVHVFGQNHPGEICRPSFWRGFYLCAERIEFWLDGANRLHDRFLFTKQGDRWQKIAYSVPTPISCYTAIASLQSSPVRSMLLHNTGQMLVLDGGWPALPCDRFRSQGRKSGKRRMSGQSPGTGVLYFSPVAVQTIYVLGFATGAR